MPKADIGGDVSLSYDLSGSGEKPVVFIHGALIARPFAVLRTEPALTSYRLIEFDRRGYGASSAADGVLSITDQANDCRALLGELGITRAHIVGHSFGGAVALELALDHPSVVQSVALLEPALMIGETGPQYRESLEQGMSRFREADTAVLVGVFMEARWPGYRERLDSMMPGAFDQAVVDATTTFEVDLPGLLQWSFDEAAAARLTQPCLSVLGEESERLWSRFGEVHRWLLERVPVVEGNVISGAHHMMMLENPGDLAEALHAFFASHPIRM